MTITLLSDTGGTICNFVAVKRDVSSHLASVDGGQPLGRGAPGCNRQAGVRPTPGSSNCSDAGSTNSSEQAGHVAARIRTAIQRPMTLPDGAQVSVGVSIGVGSTAVAGSLEELLADADERMYQAKNPGDHPPH